MLNTQIACQLGFVICYHATRHVNKQINSNTHINRHLSDLLPCNQKALTCKPGKTALLMADSKSTPLTGSFLKKIMPPLGPLKDWKEMSKYVSSSKCALLWTKRMSSWMHNVIQEVLEANI